MRPIGELFVAAYGPLVRRRLRGDRRARCRGLRLDIPQGVFHPRLFFSTMALDDELQACRPAGRTVLDVGTGSGYLALSAARAGAAAVIAVDISPQAVRTARANAAANGLGRVEVVESDLFEALGARRFDLVVVNPPYFPADGATMADRAFYAGTGFSYFDRFFCALGDHLREGAAVRMVLGGACDIGAIGALAEQHGWRLVPRRTAWRRLAAQVVYAVERAPGFTADEPGVRLPSATMTAPASRPDPTSGRRAIDPETAARYRARGWWRDRTALDDFLDTAAAEPERTAVVSYHTGGGGPERHTYRELETLSRRVAGALIDLGVERDDVVSVQLPNSWQFPAIVYGILRAGAIVNPLVPIFRQRELQFILGRTGSKVLFVPDLYRNFDHAAMALGLVGELDSLRHIVVVGARTAGAIDFASHIVGRPWEDTPGLEDTLAARRPGPDDLIEIQFTSGTTGEPKGVLHSHNTVYSGGRMVPEVYGLGRDDVCFMASTLAHQTGFSYGLVGPLGMGMKVVYQDLWDAAATLDIIDAEGVSWTLSATTFVMDVVAAQRAKPHSLATFKYFACGGAPIPPRVVRDAHEVLGAELIAVWGMTENMVVTTTRPGDSAELVSDSDGICVDWMEVRIVDDDGAAVPVDGVGHLQVRGPSQALGYFARPDLYEAASTPDGWFDTGDLARLRADGGIRIAGRTKDLVIRGGENIPVVEIENVLYTYPGLVDVAVIGVPDERLGERACAVVTTEGSTPTLAELTAFLEQKGVAKQFWPERLEVVPAMPKTPSGKIQKFQLRAQLEG